MTGGCFCFGIFIFWISEGSHSFARVLLMCDEGQLAEKKWTDEAITEALNIHRNTVGRMVLVLAS